MSASQNGDGAAAELFDVPKRPRGKARRRAGKPRRSSLDLFHWNDLPEYLKDNEYIVTGYRADTGFLGSLKSLFRLHNESGNVWTHLCGFVFFIFLLVAIVRSPPTPMALRSDDVEALWLAVSHRLDNVSSTVLRQLHTLQSGVASHVHPLHGLSTETDGHPRLTLKEGLTRSLHSLEHRVERGARAAAQSLHAFGAAVMEPRALADSLTKMTSSLPHDISTGIDRVASAVTPPPARLQDQPQQVQAAALSLLEAEAEGQRHEGATGAAALDAWLHAVVSKSVMWPVPRWPLYVFMAGAMFCLLASATCHLLGCCNRHIAASIWRFDYAGIVANIVSSFYPSIYYVFLCMPVPRAVYLAGITVLGAATLALSTLERFQHPKWRHVRAASFALLGAMGVVPWGHVLLAYPHTESVNGAMAYDLLMAVAYLSAAAFYALRIPEKWYPGRFDFWMHSHQIFHIFVIVGCYLHYLSSVKLVQWRDASGGCALELTHSHAVEHAVRGGDGLVDVESMLVAFQRRLGALWHRHSAASDGSGGAAIGWEPWEGDTCAWHGS